MTLDARVQEMQAQFSTTFTAVASTQIVWDGIENEAIDKDNSWISVFIDPNLSRLVSMGSPKRVRHRGFFTVQIFTKKDTGSKAANIISEDVAASLEGEELAAGVIFGASIINRVGNNKGYYQVNVLTPYRYTDIRT